VLVLPLLAVAITTPLGMALVPRRRSLILALIGAIMLTSVLVISEPRYHLPLIPYLAAYAAAAWTTPGILRQAAQGVRNRQPAWLLAAGAAGLLLLVWVYDLLNAWPTLMRLLGPGGNNLFLTY
jgi:hypothetical protein